MATGKSIYIPIIFGILIIAAWLLGSVTQAGAQTYTMKCREGGHLVKQHTIEVGDVPGHIVFVGELFCDDEGVGTASNWIMGDMTKGSGRLQEYWLVTYEDGSTTWAKVQTTVTPEPNGKTRRYEFTFEYIKGTGRFEGIQGSGTGTGKSLESRPGVGFQYYVDYTATYTLLK
jgi:hypothetical protein